MDGIAFVCRAGHVHELRGLLIQSERTDVQQVYYGRDVLHVWQCPCNKELLAIIPWPSDSDRRPVPVCYDVLEANHLGIAGTPLKDSRETLVVPRCSVSDLLKFQNRGTLPIYTPLARMVQEVGEEQASG